MRTGGLFDRSSPNVFRSRATLLKLCPQHPQRESHSVAGQPGSKRHGHYLSNLADRIVTKTPREVAQAPIEYPLRLRQRYNRRSTAPSCGKRVHTHHPPVGRGAKTASRNGPDHRGWCIHLQSHSTQTNGRPQCTARHLIRIETGRQQLRRAFAIIFHSHQFRGHLSYRVRPRARNSLVRSRPAPARLLRSVAPVHPVKITLFTVNIRNQQRHNNIIST